MKPLRRVAWVAGLVTVVTLGLAWGCCQQQAAEPSATTERIALSEQLLGIWNEGDLGLIDEHYAPGYVRHLVDTGDDVVGQEAFKAAVTEFRTALPDLVVTLDEIMVAGDRTVAQWTITGTHTGPLGELPPTGKSVRFSGVLISQIVGGMVVEDWLYYNGGGFQQQLGFTLTPPVAEMSEGSQE